MLKAAKHVLTLLTCALICGCETTNSAKKGSAFPADSTAYVHPSSQFSFPEFAGVFHRGGMQKFDKEGKNIGVGYASSIPIIATVFIYPAPTEPDSASNNEALLGQQFKRCKQELMHSHDDAKLLGESPGKIIQGNNQFIGKKATFSLSYQFGLFYEDSISELYVFLIEPGGKLPVTEPQFIKYRFTYPVKKKAQAEPEVAAFMTDLLWPAK